jgi:hypothetical protein
MMRRNSESGQALIFGVATLGILLMGIAGLGIDIGYLRYEKRLQQTAADNAALAGASELQYADVNAIAQNAAQNDGFTAASVNANTFPPPAPATAVGSVSLTVNNPPLSGPHANDSSTNCSPAPSCYVEVYLAQVQPTFFMKMLGTTSQTVTARAVAYWGSANGTPGCVYSLGINSGKGIQGITVHGNPTLDADFPGYPCGIDDNGDFTTNGQKLDVSAGAIGVAGTVGKVQGTVTCGGSSTNCPVPGIAIADDPLGYLQPPTSGTPYASGGANGTCPDGAGTVFAPGMYLVTGAMKINANSIVCGTGVTFYISGSGSVTINGGADVQFSAPSSGTYAGILFYQDRSDTSSAKVNGNSNSFFQGAMYFPSAALDFSGTGSTLNSGAAYTLIVSDSLTVGGNATVDLKSDLSSLPNGSPIKTVTLVE